jgi:methionyl-tRNA synthetase
MTENKKFYITTPIYYPSDNLHIGHAYTTVAADAMKRFKKLQGYDTYFLTGTDEHGQKIQRKAAEAGKTPQEFVDEIVAGVKDLWKLMNIDYDDFIRTTDKRHEEVVQKLFQKVYDQGDIYKSEYSGWYCTPCETFFTERQLGEGHTCPDCGRPVELTKEESYFFKMSKYADRWLKFIEDNPDFIQPETRRNEMINFVKQGLDDLCVSRTTFDWGIKVPFDEKHVVYVWFDALINYISALGYGTENDELYQKYWPANVHLMAKDIIRFHSIIWPIMLMALDIPIPQKVVAHGWLLMSDGKMSKSKGNVVDPRILADRYGVDAIRFFLLREMAYGMDAVYSEEALVNRINIDLANDYGNLISRTTSMIQKFNNGIISAPGEKTQFDDELIALAEATPENMAKYMDKVDVANAIGEVWKLVSKANKYIDDCAPWALNKAGETEKLRTVLYNLAEVIRFITILISPVMPNTPEKVWEQMGLCGHEEIKTWDSLKWGGFPTDIKVNRGDPIFPRIDLAEMQKQWAAEAEAKEKVEAAKKFEPIKEEITIDDFAKIDLRVCKVLSCEKVKKADKLLKMEVLVGAEKRTVVSGIAMHYTPEEMVGKQLVLVANLKPAKLRGIESQGMILAASHNGEMKILEVPAEILPGGQVK